MDKIPPLLSSSGGIPPFGHPDPLLMSRGNPLIHPLPLHALAGGHKLPLGFSSPFGPSPHDAAALRHLDSLGLRPMNPAQIFANQSPFSPPLGRPPPTPGLDPMTAAILLESSRYRGLIPPFANPSPSPIIPPLPSSTNATTNGTHNHAHIHSHSHTHLHLGNSNDSSSTNSTPANGPPPPPPPPPLMPFANPLAGLSHGNPLLHPGGLLPPSSLEAIHNLARERELMNFVLANNNRLDPMALALANSLQVGIDSFFSDDDDLFVYSDATFG